MLLRVFASASLFVAVAIADGPDTNWPRFRGPAGMGVSADKVPTK